MSVSRELAKRGFCDEDHVAGLLGVAQATLKQWRCHGRGPTFVKIGKRVLYREADLDAWIDEQARTPRPAAA